MHFYKPRVHLPLPAFKSEAALQSTGPDNGPANASVLSLLPLLVSEVRDQLLAHGPVYTGSAGKFYYSLTRLWKPPQIANGATPRRTFVGWYRFRLGDTLQSTSHWHGLVEATVEADAWRRLKARTACLGPVDLAVLPEGKRPRIRSDRKVGHEYLLWRSTKDHNGGGSSDQHTGVSCQKIKGCVLQSWAAILVKLPWSAFKL